MVFLAPLLALAEAAVPAALAKTPRPRPLECGNQTTWWTTRGMTQWQQPGSVTFPGVASPGDCCALCERNASCNAWTYYDWHNPTSDCVLAPFAMISYGVNLTSGSTTPPTWQPPAPQPPLPTTGECHYVQDTVYDVPFAVAGDNWQKSVDATSAGQCCAICRTLAECSVSNYQPEPWTGDALGSCTLRGQVNLSHPTHVLNATACVVKTRPAAPQPAPPGAMNVLYIVSDDARPEMPSFGQDCRDPDAFPGRSSRIASPPPCWSPTRRGGGVQVGHRRTTWRWVCSLAWTLLSPVSSVPDVAVASSAWLARSDPLSPAQTSRLQVWQPSRRGG